MPNFLSVKNNAYSTLQSGITAGDTSLTVASGEGARFPTSDFHITIDSEILKCTSRTVDVFTVTRAQEGTSAAAHGAGAAVRLNITAAIVTEIQEALRDVSCSVYQSAPQAIPTSTWQPIYFDSEFWDTDNIHHNVTNNSRLTCTKDGRYLVWYSACFATNPAGVIRGAFARKNGSGGWEFIKFFMGKDTDGRWQASGAAMCNLVVGDYIELVMFHSVGSDLNTLAGTTATQLGMKFLP